MRVGTTILHINTKRLHHKLQRVPRDLVCLARLQYPAIPLKGTKCLEGRRGMMCCHLSTHAKLSSGSFSRRVD